MIQLLACIGMITGFFFLLGICLGLGLFFILADVLRLPLLSTERAMLSVVRKEKKAAKSLETYLLGFAVKLSKFIKMDEFKRIRMKNVLDAAGLAMTPEVYQAYAFVKAGAILLGVIPCLLIFPLSMRMNIGLFGGFGSFPVTLRADASGKSEVYWK